LDQLRDIELQLHDLGVQVICVSPDQPSKVRGTIERHNLNFLLLSDSQMTASQAFRIAYEVDDATLKVLAQHGVDLEAASGEKHHQWLP
jgi:peroxiredoxin